MFVRVGGRKTGLHRVVYEEHFGPIPDGHHVHHRCGNRSCVNPEHLETLTPAAHNALARRCDHGDEDRYVKPDGHTRCRICHREKWRIRYASDPEFRERHKRISREAMRRR